MDYIDLRSDTVTHPTKLMREKMAIAPVGDDVYGDDPTILELERTSAELLGKEAAMFVPSGTFGNQVSIMTHTRRGQEIILGENCHVIAHEAGAAALLSGVQTRTVRDDKGEMDPRDVRRVIRKDIDIHFPTTGLICVETAHSCGRVPSLEVLKEIRSIADEFSIPVHMDGARFFNAIAYYGVDPKELAALADTVTFCLSKGLCAPVGSVVVGTRDFIEKARKNRKIMGGGMRQAGILAAAGLEALKLRDRIPEDHDNARYFGEELSKLPGIEVNKEDIQINMIFFNMEKTGKTSQELVTYLKENNVLINGEDSGLMRFVTHYWITRERIDTVLSLMKEFLA
ncbi:MAG TPA: low-specificity L-threonine aldolase [Clostridiaceae bacterium]|nr:low-specificity L-threonine aldolase [Clostridiaceae bacterium]